MFRDRRQAGELLGQELKKRVFKHDPIVIGLPRGGVVVADAVALVLHLPLDIICPRKIGAPFNTEFAIGAVDENGHLALNQEAVKYLQVSKEYIEEIAAVEVAKSKKRLEIFRKGMPPRNLKEKSVILVDDGLATGYTMKAAIGAAKEAGAAELIVAVPVSSKAAAIEIAKQSDQFLSLLTPPDFSAVGQFYLQFEQTEDEEVVKILQGQRD